MAEQRTSFAQLAGSNTGLADNQQSIAYLQHLWGQGGYKTGLTTGTMNRGDNWLARGFLDDQGTFGASQYQKALDAGYTPAQIYQGLPGAIGGSKGLKRINPRDQGAGALSLHDDLMRDQGTWLTAYQNAGGKLGERPLDELEALAKQDWRIPGTQLPGQLNVGGRGTKITPKTIWDAREGVKLGDNARQRLIKGLESVDPLRHKNESFLTRTGPKGQPSRARHYSYTDPGDTDAFGNLDYNELNAQRVSIDEMRSIADTKSRIGTEAAKKLWNYTDPGDTDAFGMKDVRQLEGQGVSRATMRRIESGMNELGEGAREHLYGLNINAPDVAGPARLTKPRSYTGQGTPMPHNLGYKAGRSATTIKRQNPQAMTNRNARGTWGRGSQFFQAASNY